MEENKVYDSKVKVDMSAYGSDEVKELRVKMRECQSQMEYLGYKYSLYQKEFDALKKEYDKKLGVSNG